MKRAIVYLLILLITFSALCLDVSRANPIGPYNRSYIYIRADGSVEPVTSPITRVGDNYYLTGNITADSLTQTSYSIVIEKDNIVLDGSNYSLGVAEQGIIVSNRHNITIQNLSLCKFNTAIVVTLSYNITIRSNVISQSMYGVDLQKCNNTVIANNDFHDNLDQAAITLSSSNNVIVYGNQLINGYGTGIWLEYSSNNYIIANSIVHHYFCIMLVNASGNYFSYNNMIPDNESVSDYRDNNNETDYAVNNWNSNYWSNYSPSVLDSSYRINKYNVDNAPLSKPVDIDQTVPLDSVNPINMVLIKNKQMSNSYLYVTLAIVILAVIALMLLVLFYRRRKAKEINR
jgi:parallel beta-helix repeat protein